MTLALPLQRRFDIAIIGAGFSGTMVAVNLAHKSPCELKIALIERGPAAGRGVAYGTTDALHLLNVPAGQMGAFADDPGHFWRWLSDRRGQPTAPKVQHAGPGLYAPRQLYGAYLQDVLSGATANHPGIEIVQDNIVALADVGDEGFKLTGASGNAITADSVVLALGNFPPAETGSTAGGQNPYSPEVWERLAAPGDILIVGTGLTSLDLVVTLARRKEVGTIHLLSRRGLFPQAHRDAAHHEPFLDSDSLPSSALALSRATRSRIREVERDGGDWRSVVDSLRPLNQRIWQQLDIRERRRFLRRLRAYWDTHRHRCAPEILEVRDQLRAQGRLLVHRGRVISLVENGEADAITVNWRPSGRDQMEQFNVRQVVSCTGPQSDVRRLDDALVKNLLGQGLIAPDPVRIGIATDTDYTVSAAVKTTGKLYTLGSPLRGRLYESIAVPELRVQARDVAMNLLRDRNLADGSR